MSKCREGFFFHLYQLITLSQKKETRDFKLVKLYKDCLF